MSGGEDPRIIATPLSDNSKVAGITFVDSYNNEVLLKLFQTKYSSI